MQRRFLLAIPAVIVLIAVYIGGVHYADSKSDMQTKTFVTKSGNQLTVNGNPFRVAGADMQWLGIDEMANDANGNPTYPDAKKIANGFDAAAAMHATVVRSHSLGISTGSPWSIEPTLGTFNDKAFAPIDEAVRAADERHIRLIIPLTDMWSYKTGGKRNFTEWNGYQSLKAGDKPLDANDKAQRLVEANFYTDDKVIKSYEEYIKHVLDHKDPKTGVALKDNPVVLAWETGNELWDAPAKWTQTIAQFIKQYCGAKQLVGDGSGSSGTSDSGARLANAGAALDNPDVDIVSTHIYSNIGGTTAAPAELSGTTFFNQATQDVNADAAIAKAHNKVYYIGEFDWTGGANEATWKQTFDATALQTFVDSVKQNSDVSGDLFWALFPYNAQGQPEHYNQRFWMVNPPVNYEPEMTKANTVLSNHAQQMAKSS